MHLTISFQGCDIVYLLHSYHLFRTVNTRSKHKSIDSCLENRWKREMRERERGTNGRWMWNTEHEDQWEELVMMCDDQHRNHTQHSNTHTHIFLFYFWRSIQNNISLGFPTHFFIFPFSSLHAYYPNEN